MTDQITAILNTCSSSTNALRLPRSHGRQLRELYLVARATTVASMLVAAHHGAGSLARANASALSV